MELQRHIFDKPISEAKPRQLVLGTILVLEILLTILFRRLGWDSTWYVAAAGTIAVTGIALLCGSMVGIRRWARDRYRFRMRTLLLGFVVISVALAPLSAIFMRPYLERRAARELLRLGIEIDTVQELKYMKQFGHRSTDHLLQIPFIVPKDQDIAVVKLHDDATVEASFRYLNRLPNLVEVILFDEVTDRGLQRISQLKCPALRSVSPVASQISDKGLDSLLECQWLTGLFVYGDQISSRGLSTVSELKHVKDLGLIRMSGDRQRITDGEFRKIAGMARLERLTIQSFDITDDQAQALSSLTQLRELNLWDTKVTEEGKDELRKALPRCAIK